MNFILIILFSIITLYIALIYKVYVSFNKKIKLSILSASIIPFMIYDLNRQAAKELKVSNIKMLIDTYLYFDIFVYVLYQIIKKQTQGKKVEVKVSIRMSKLIKESRQEYTDQMKIAKIL